jgi:hypothetical protein
MNNPAWLKTNYIELFRHPELKAIRNEFIVQTGLQVIGLEFFKLALEFR